MLKDSYEGLTNTCCDTTQLHTLDSNINLAANFLKRCPSCLDNLVKHFCEFTCSPHQATFINVTELVHDGTTSKRINYNFDPNLSMIYSGGDLKI